MATMIDFKTSMGNRIIVRPSMFLYATSIHRESLNIAFMGGNGLCFGDNLKVYANSFECQHQGDTKNVVVSATDDFDVDRDRLCINGA